VKLPTVKRGQRRARLAPVTFSEEDGVRFLHFGTEWIQGAMRLKRPDDIELEYAQQMMAPWLFIDHPEHVMQLGLGAASLTKFCYRHMPTTRVSVVELNEEVIIAARSMFKLPPDDDRLTVVHEDAASAIAHPGRRHTLDWLQVDLYDAAASGPVLESEAFYRDCERALKSPGVMSVNLFGDHPSFKRNWHAIAAVFKGRAVALPEVHAGNRVVLAFKGPPLNVTWARLYAAAGAIEQRSGLDATPWVSSLKSVLRFSPDGFSV
jgi:spermidine synthase